MDELKLRKIMNDYIKEICHYSQIQVFATSTNQMNYFQMQIDEATDGLFHYIQAYIEGTDYEEELYSMQLVQGAVTEQLPNAPTLAGYQCPPRTTSQCVPIDDSQLKEITAEELAYNDGSEGKSAYVAVDGNVYDVTMAIRWAGGTHFGLYAGKDLSNEFLGCHNGMTEILEILPLIGVYKG